MLRLKILASAVPLLIAAVFARGDFLPGARPCIAIGEGSVQITSLPWQAQSHVSFTRDPALATVRVQLTDNAAAADFAVLDDIDSTEARWLRGQRGDPLRGDLRRPIGIRARDLSVAGRSRRLPDFCRFEAFFGARRRRPHRRRQWRAAPAGCCSALNFLLTPCKPRSDRTTPSHPASSTSQGRRAIFSAATGAASTATGSRHEAADFPDQGTHYAVSPGAIRGSPSPSAPS